MRHTGDEAGHEEPVVVGSEGGPDVADDERDRETDEQRLARPGRPEHREERGTHDDARGIRRDACDPAVGIDTETPSAMSGQQAHRDELGRADGEAADDEGDGREEGMTRRGHRRLNLRGGRHIPSACADEWTARGERGWMRRGAQGDADPLGPPRTTASLSRSMRCDGTFHTCQWRTTSTTRR